ncbi:MAG: redoxin domain-containing protein [Phycisphaerales bacterium]
MNRIVVSLGALWTIFALASTGLGQTPARERTERPGVRPAPTVADATGMQVPMGLRQQRQKLQQQIEELKGAHRDLVAQLEAVHETAVKEKATETAAQVKTLIAKRQEAFQTSLVKLEQEQAQLQRVGRERPARTGAAGQARGKQAPPFELSSFNNSTTIKLSDYKDRIVVLEWMNPECPFSRYHYETVHTMANLAAKYKDKNVVWLAVNSTNNTTVEANREFAKKHKLPYPILDDRTGQVGRQYGARNTPHMFVIDTNGVIVYAGAIDNAPLGKQEPSAGSVNYVDKALTELLAGQKVSTPTTPPYGCTVKYSAQ